MTARLECNFSKRQYKFSARIVFWKMNDVDIIDCNRIKEEALPDRIPIRRLIITQSKL